MKKFLLAIKHLFIGIVNYAKHEDIIKYYIVSVALFNLAISKYYINDILIVENKLTGIVFFSYILSGLVSAFNAFKLTKSGKKGLLVNMFMLLLTATFAFILSYQMIACVGNQVKLTSVWQIDSVFTLIGFGAVYFFIFIVILVRYFKVSGHAK